jgi:hypothetical protein
MCKNLKTKDERCGNKILITNDVTDPDDVTEVILKKGDITYLSNIQNQLAEAGLWEAFYNEADLVMINTADFKIIR